jgi:hypothetical protein
MSSGQNRKFLEQKNLQQGSVPDTFVPHMNNKLQDKML